MLLTTVFHLIFRNRNHSVQVVVNIFGIVSVGASSVVLRFFWGVSAACSASAAKLAASTLAAMNPHYHPYGGPELASPHPPSPDNNNYHGHGGPGGPHNHGHMHPSNGHGPLGPLGKKQELNMKFEVVVGQMHVVQGVGEPTNL